MINLTGERFGALTVTERSPSGLWVCRCDCGGLTYVKTGDLRRGRVKTCGCSHRASRPKDRTGERIGRLTVLSYAGERRWLCRCDCGREVTVYAYNLKPGNTTSCGCAKKERARTLNSKGNKNDNLRIYSGIHGHADNGEPEI